MWDNLMNTTAPSIPQVYYRCREAIQNDIVNSVCLIPGQENPSDAITKMRDNENLKMALADGICVTPPTSVFMLQVSKYRNATFILTSSVPMVNDVLHFPLRRTRNIRPVWFRNMNWTT